MQTENYKFKQRFFKNLQNRMCVAKEDKKIRKDVEKLELQAKMWKKKW